MFAAPIAAFGKKPPQKIGLDGGVFKIKGRDLVTVVKDRRKAVIAGEALAELSKSAKAVINKVK